MGPTVVEGGLQLPVRDLLAARGRGSTLGGLENHSHLEIMARAVEERHRRAAGETSPLTDRMDTLEETAPLYTTHGLLHAETLPVQTEQR